MKDKRAKFDQLPTDTRENPAAGLGLQPSPNVHVPYKRN